MIQNEFYVYIYLREDETPYYVGKGQGRRAFKNSGRRMKKPSDETKIVFHSENLTEDEAFVLERELIKKYGRKDNCTGILRNLTDGGEGTSGYKWTHEAKIKLSEACKKSMTPERKAAISKLTKKQYSSLESRSKHSKIMKEILNTPEFKKKQSEIMKEIVNRPEVKDKQKKTISTPEFKEKHSKIMKESHNTPEYKEKHSKIMKETHNTPEYKEKQSEIMKELRNRPEVEAKRMKAFNETIAKRKAEKLQESANLTKFIISDPVSD